MLKGTVGFELKRTEGYEYGIYRQNESGQTYLLFTFDDESEWLAKGRAIADIFSLPLKINKSDPCFGKRVERKENITKHIVESTSTPSRPKKVSGVGDLCRTYIQQGLSDEEIVQNLLPKYLAVGRNEQSARNTVLNYLYWIRKEKGEQI